MTEKRVHGHPIVPTGDDWLEGLIDLQPLRFSGPVPKTRRDFCRFLAASPLLAPLLASGCASGSSGASAGLATTLDGAGRSPLALSAMDVLDIPELEELARRALPPAHFGYIATGVSGDETLRANREGFSNYYLRARRLVDISTVDSSIELFGTRWETPIVLAPAGSQRAFHPQGEIAVARAARSRGHLQVLSTVATSSVEDVTEARGAPIWYQLYPTANWEITERMIRRAEAAGCQALVLTVDLQAGGPRDTLERARRADDRDCTRCHGAPDNPPYARKPMFDGFQPADVRHLVRAR